MRSSSSHRGAGKPQFFRLVSTKTNILPPFRASGADVYGKNKALPGSSLVTGFKAEKYLDFHHQTSNLGTMVTKGRRGGNMPRYEAMLSREGNPVGNHAQLFKEAADGEMPRMAEPDARHAQL